MKHEWFKLVRSVWIVVLATIYSIQDLRHFGFHWGKASEIELVSGGIMVLLWVAVAMSIEPLPVKVPDAPPSQPVTMPMMARPRYPRLARKEELN